MFVFAVVAGSPVVQFSGDYVIGVGVGVNSCAVVVVCDAKAGRIVCGTALSRRVHSLWKSVRASGRQVRGLRKKAGGFLARRWGRMAVLGGVQFRREAASGKRRGLAILAAQEIAYLAHVWGRGRRRGSFELDR